MQLSRSGHEAHQSILIWIALMSFIWLSGCGAGQKNETALVPEVATITVQPQQVELTTELPGRLAPYRIAEIRPQVNGLIQKRLFKEGSDVQAEDVLYQIDPAPFKATLDNAKAALNRAEANLPTFRLRANRYREAVADKAVSQQDLDDADAALKQTEADIQYYTALMETASINLGYARIVAPISGRIGRSTVTDGAIVTAYQPLALATIQQLDPIYVDIQQSTSELLRLKQRVEDGGLKHDEQNRNGVKLFLEDGTTYPIEGTLQFQDVSVEQTTGSVTLRALFPNPKGVLLPGMFVRAVVKEGVDPQAILIPQQTISRDPKGNPLVQVVNAESKVAQRLLSIDRALGAQWLVSSGLESGDRVIVEGMQKIRPGMAVREIPFNSAPATN